MKYGIMNWKIRKYGHFMASRLDVEKNMNVYMIWVIDITWRRRGPEIGSRHGDGHGLSVICFIPSHSIQ